MFMVSLVSLSVTLMQLIAALWAFSFRTKWRPEQYVVTSPREVPKIASDYIECPSR